MSHESTEVPTHLVEAVDAALTEILGMHGPWVLAVETYDENSEQVLTTMWPASSTAWTLIGIARSLSLDIETPLRNQED